MTYVCVSMHKYAFICTNSINEMFDDIHLKDAITYYITYVRNDKCGCYKRMQTTWKKSSIDD